MWGQLGPTRQLILPQPPELTHDRPPPPPTPHRPPKRVGAWSAVVEHAVLPPTCGCNHPYSGEAMPHLQLEGWVVL
eukprot:scaffold712_cov155-Isochrysis_galbana.AAC.1